MRGYTCASRDPLAAGGYARPLVSDSRLLRARSSLPLCAASLLLPDAAAPRTAMSSRRSRGAVQAGAALAAKRATSTTRSSVYEALDARYPFSDSARQARLDLMYAYYSNARPNRRSTRPTSSSARTRPIRASTTRWYIKGLVDFERTPNMLERCFTST